MATTSTPETRVKRHPIRGGIYGLFTGLGTAVLLVLFAVTPYKLNTIIIITAISVIVGVLWGLFAPAKKNKDAPPMNSSLSPAFTRSSGAEDAPAPTYEDTFGGSEAPQPPVDDGTFGAGEPAPDTPPQPVSDPLADVQPAAEPPGGQPPISGDDESSD